MLKAVVYVVLTTIVLSLPANAQPICLPRADVVAGLSGQHKEAPVAIGVTSAGAVVELWTSGGGETWTIVVTMPAGSACVIAAGEAWQGIDRPPRGKHL